MDAQANLIILFAVVVVSFLVVDLGFLNRKSHRIEFKPALYQSLFWVGTALIFGFLTYVFMGKDTAIEFLSAYVTEEMLSIDNLFVILLIFRYFKLEEKYYHKVLFWGILGAIIFRGIFIGAGAYIIHQFYWVLYVFGGALFYTGIKLLRDKKEEHIDFNKSKVIKFAHKIFPFTNSHHGGKFFFRENGKLFFTSFNRLL